MATVGRTTRWKVVEKLSSPSKASRAWDEARELGARGAVTSWGSGISHKRSISLYWEIGHGGGADILYNLDLLLERAGPGKHRIVIVGNGLGYSWSALVVEVDVPKGS